MGYHCVNMPQYARTGPVLDYFCPVQHDDAMRWKVLPITGLSTGSFDVFYVAMLSKWLNTQSKYCVLWYHDADVTTL